MTEDNAYTGFSAPVELAKESYSDGGDYQLLCCGPSGGGSFGGGGSTDNYLWISAAEVVYEFTGNAGSVVRNQITFGLNATDRIEIDLLDGSFALHLASNAEVLTGRKAVELLMLWKDMTLVGAIEYLAEKYSPDQAMMLGQDYVRMKVRQHVANRNKNAAS